MSATTIVFRITPESAPDESDGLAGHFDKISKGQWSKLERDFSGIRVASRFFPEFAAFLGTKEASADGFREPEPDLSLYFDVSFDVPSEGGDIVARLAEMEFVDVSYLEPEAADPQVNPDDDPRFAGQGYLQPAPLGIDAVFAWTVDGGDGRAQRFVDVEQGWTLNHEDLAAQAVQHVFGNISNTSRSHGTSVLGEVCAVDNQIGCVGITPNLGYVGVSSNNGTSMAGAILAAAQALNSHGVILLEQQWVNWQGFPNFIIEAADDVFDAIRIAVARGMTVIEAAGNGGHDLDTFSDATYGRIFDRQSTDFRDSGAVVVGAGSSTVPHFRLNFSNHGSRIDCYGWGHNVNTCASNAAAATNLYTTLFNGTSSASPIVAGAALSLRGMAEHAAGISISPALMRALLADPANGTQSNLPAVDRIGVMPDLRRLSATLGITPDIYIRDNIFDHGNPSSGSLSQSPDIIVRNTQVADPEAAFGDGSGTENDVGLSDVVDSSRTNFVYLRAKNRSTVNATQSICDVYWAHPSTLITPQNWNLIGSQNLGTVPKGNLLKVSGQIDWPSADIPGSGHYCFIGVIHHASDPAPDLPPLNNIDNFVHFIRNGNNVAWRNFDVRDMAAPSGYEEHRLPFVIRNTDQKVAMSVELTTRLPPGSYAAFRYPPAAPKAVPVHGRVMLYDDVVLPPLQEVEIHVRIPHSHWHIDDYEVSARQYYKGTEVGRVTWLFEKRLG